MMLWLAQTGSGIGYLSADDGVSKLQEQFEGELGIQEDDSDDGQNEFSEAVEFEDRKDFSGRNGVAEGMGPEVKDDDDNDDGDEFSRASPPHCTFRDSTFKFQFLGFPPGRRGATATPPRSGRSRLPSPPTIADPRSLSVPPLRPVGFPDRASPRHAVAQACLAVSPSSLPCNLDTGFSVAASYLNDTPALKKADIGSAVPFQIVVRLSVGNSRTPHTMVGYGWAGMLRKYLVDPVEMWWPSNVTQVSLFR